MSLTLMSWRRLLYSIVLYITIPFLLLRLIQRSRLQPAYRKRLGERFGYVRSLAVSSIAGTTSDAIDKNTDTETPLPEHSPVICLHAVSVGETIAARPLIEYLLKQFPHHRLWITSTTPTGSLMVKQLFAERVEHSYLPYDLPFGVKRFINTVKPCLLLVMETELWPNLYRCCQVNKIPVLLVNARLSATSARRYQKVQGLLRETLAAAPLIAARHIDDAKLFRQLGARDDQVQVFGNIKFALQLENSIIKQAKPFIAQWGARPIWCAASTHAGEDEQFLQIHQQLRQHINDVLLILVPRHPERFESVAMLCAQAGLSCVRRSAGDTLKAREDTTKEAAVFLGDTLGELLIWYAVCDVAVIGGSFSQRGGHNPLEAALLGKPVLSGPHIDNFMDIYPPLTQAGGAQVVDSYVELEQRLSGLLSAPKQAVSMGTAGRAFMLEKQQPINKLFKAISSYIA